MAVTMAVGTLWSLPADAASTCRRTVHVADLGDDGSPGQLRSALAAVCTGGRVLIEAGTVSLSDELVLDRDVVVAAKGWGQVTLDAGAAPTLEGGELIGPSTIQRRVLRVDDGARVTLIGLSLQGGVHEDSGGGVRNAGDLTLDHTDVVGNYSTAPGGGIYNEGVLTLRYADVGLNNSGLVASAGGSGIYNAGTLQALRSSIAGNGSQHGDAGGLWNVGTATLERVDLSYNVASDFTGGGFINDGVLRFARGTMDGNHAFIGGAGLNNGELTITRSTLGQNSHEPSFCGYTLHNRGTTRFDRVRFEDNAAEGAVLNEGTVTGSNLVIVENRLSEDSGAGGAYSQDDCGGFGPPGVSPSTFLTGVVIRDNLKENFSGGAHGGGLAVRAGTVHLVDATIEGNHAFSEFGDPTFGGGAYVGPFGSLTLEQSTVTENVATAGGGIYNDGGLLSLIDTAIFANIPDDCVGPGCPSP
jgi:hypothetical protein